MAARQERDASTSGDFTTLVSGEKASPSARPLPAPEVSDLSPITEPTTAESKIEQLETRVIALERVVSHMAELTKHTRHSDQYVTYILKDYARLNAFLPSLVESPSAALQASVAASGADEETEGNMFAVFKVRRDIHTPSTSQALMAYILTWRQSGSDDVSLSSQVAAMGAYLSRPTSPKPSNPGRRHPKTQLLVEFPDPPTLQHLLVVYFRDFDCYFPFLDREETEPRIYAVIRRLGYSSHNRMLLVGTQDLSLIALTSIMLGFAECLDSEAGARDGDSSKPGWNYYLQALRAVQRFFYTKDVDLDVVRTQCLIAAYLMHSEILRAASQAVSVALQLATDIKLNDQRAWSADSPDEILSKQLLWWTIFFLDRRIAQKASLPYHIRDTEFYVEDFKGTDHTRPDEYGHSDPKSPSSLHRAKGYVQVLINLARLWGQVWDKFFAIGAKRKTDWMEMEIMDTQILNVRRQLPLSLTWEHGKMAEYALSGEPEPQLRRRLHVYTACYPSTSCEF